MAGEHRWSADLSVYGQHVRTNNEFVCRRVGLSVSWFVGELSINLKILPLVIFSPSMLLILLFTLKVTLYTSTFYFYSSNLSE